MKYVLLLFGLACSFLGAQETSSTLSRITGLIKQGQTLLDAQQAKNITIAAGQTPANLIYDNLDLELTEYEKEPNPDAALIGQADQVLFKLSNYFDLRTPAKELADQFKDIVNTRSAEWESKTGEHLTPEDIADPAKKEEALSYLQYIFSGLGHIDVSKIFVMMPYVLNVSYDKAREYAKKAFLAAGYVEASLLNQQRVAQALKQTDYKHDVIVLEDPNPNVHYGAITLQTPPFKFIVLASKYFNDVNFDEFGLYHEIGHLYYNHPLLKMIDSYAGILTALSTIPSVAGSLLGVVSLSTVVHLALSSLIITAIKGFSKSAYSRSYERDADLFACNQLIKQGRLDLVYSELHGIRGNLEHHELTYQVRPFLTETHPSYPARQLYLRECLKMHGLAQPNLPLPQFYYDWKEMKQDEWEVAGKTSAAQQIRDLISNIKRWYQQLKSTPHDIHYRLLMFNGYNLLRELMHLEPATSPAKINEQWLEEIIQ